jgi:2-oxo-4-hydroxy-4-carboxy-5-ureidoimidazoline decarboxylase
VTPAQLHALDRDAFNATLGGIFEHSPWVAQRAFAAGPFADVDALHAAMLRAVHDAPHAEQLALLRAHPELAGKAAIRGELTADSTHEQSGAGLDRCSPDEFAQITALNARYNATFGFPFIIAVKGLDRAAILREFARRADNPPDIEFAEALKQVARITRFRLDALLRA